MQPSVSPQWRGGCLAAGVAFCCDLRSDAFLGDDVVGVGGGHEVLDFGVDVIGGEDELCADVSYGFVLA